MFIASLPFYRKLTKQRSEKLANALLPMLTNKGKILDFGCGNGYLAETLLNGISGIEVIGVDVIKDQNLDERILKNTRFSFQIINANEPLPYLAESFDISIACASMHHTKNPEWYLTELKRITKKNGHIILVEEMYLNALDKIYISAQDWFFNKMKKGVPVPLQFRSLKNYMEEFKKNNLEIVSNGAVRPGFPFMHHYIFKLRKTE
jgi:ubiquinone/menaquinone biosynthesis C-methylase UbiE